MIEYAGLIVLAALILGTLYSVGITSKVESGVSSALCKILQQNDCDKKPTASGDDPGDPGPTQTEAAPRATDPLQVRAASVTTNGGQPQPNPQPQQPPPQEAGGPVKTPWGPSYGYGPGNPGIGDSGDLPQGGDNPYKPPKNGRGKPVKVKGKKAWKDAKGRIWEWDRLHKDHWDVTDPKTGDHKNVNPDGSEARKPKATASPSATGNPDGKNDFNWEPWGIGAGAAGAGGLLWWGGKLLSPACGPFAPACAVVL